MYNKYQAGEKVGLTGKQQKSIKSVSIVQNKTIVNKKQIKFYSIHEIRDAGYFPYPKSPHDLCKEAYKFSMDNGLEIRFFPHPKSKKGKTGYYQKEAWEYAFEQKLYLP